MPVSRLMIACVEIHHGHRIPPRCGGLGAGWSLVWATWDDPSVGEDDGVYALVGAHGAGSDSLWETLGIDAVDASGLRVVEVEVNLPRGDPNDWSHVHVLGDRAPTPFEVAAAMNGQGGWRRR